MGLKLFILGLSIALVGVLWWPIPHYEYVAALLIAVGCGLFLVGR